MEIQKCSDFINEAKAAKAPKSELRDALLDMFKKKPLVTKPDLKYKYPDEKGLYSISGIKQYLSKYGDDVDTALVDLQNDKSVELKTARIKNCLYKGDHIVYWYMNIDKDDVEKIKDKYEKEQLEKNKEIVDKRISHKKNSQVAAEAKADIKKEAKSKKSTVKKPVEKAERKPGGSPARRTRKK